MIIINYNFFNMLLIFIRFIQPWIDKYCQIL
jgi:hypothetical protein